MKHPHFVASILSLYVVCTTAGAQNAPVCASFLPAFWTRRDPLASISTRYSPRPMVRTKSSTSTGTASQTGAGGCPGQPGNCRRLRAAHRAVDRKEQLFEFPYGERFFLFRYQGHVYASANPVSGGSAAKGKRSVYLLGRDGITHLFCPLTGSQAANRAGAAAQRPGRRHRALELARGSPATRMHHLRPLRIARHP